MPINPGQGNTNAGSYVNFPPGGTTTNVYIYTTVATPVVGSSVFWTTDGSIKAPAGTYKITYPNGVKKLATVNTSGSITALIDCVWSSLKYNTELYTGTKNNCTSGSCSVVGDTITLNDGNPANYYETSGSATSTISQADADSQAQAIADAAAVAGRQNKINELGGCTWTYTSGSQPAGAYCQTYTRNNCGANCDGGTYQTCSTAKSGYAAASTISCNDAITTANNAAYTAAVNEVQASGQNNANIYGACCCWVLSYYCEGSGCQRRSVETNTCTGATRNDSYVADNSCLCGPQCQGTYYSSTDWYCSGTAKIVYQYYFCTNERTGNTNTEPCGCGTSGPNWVYQYDTCLNGTTYPVYRDLAQCSTSYNKYKANELQQDGMYAVGACGYSCADATYRLENTSGSSPINVNYGICADAIVRTITVNPGQVTYICVAVNGGVTLMDGSGSSYGSMIVTKLNDNCVI